MDGGPDNPLVANFLDPFRHLAWLAGYEVTYHPGSVVYQYSGNDETEAEVFVSLIGFILSVGLHVVLLILLGGVVWAIWDASSPTKEE
jgi:hypothetical protein